jgi:hypothetical protein
MSGVYIKGMEMPIDGFITVTITSDGRVVGNSKKENGKFEYLDNEDIAKAVPVPPHGRLIDADALTRRILDEHDKFEAMNQYDSGLRAGYRASTKAVRLAPTIIEAEEGE